jgi:hypothetical protein
LQSHIPDLPFEAREAINLAVLKLVVAAGELGITMSELQTMLELGMSPIELIDYLDTKLRRRIQ